MNKTIEKKIDETTEKCPECGQEWEFGCTSEVDLNNKVTIQCGGCGKLFSYQLKKTEVKEIQYKIYEVSVNGVTDGESVSVSIFESRNKVLALEKRRDVAKVIDNKDVIVNVTEWTYNNLQDAPISVQFDID